MTNNKGKSALICICICLLVIAVFVLFCHAVNQAGLPMQGTDIANIEQDNTDAVILGDERTDVVLCYQNPDGAMMLLNLTHQQFEHQVESYPAELLESYGILAGDFAEITYTAEYSDDGNFFIRDLKNWQQLKPSEALKKQIVIAESGGRYADNSPIQIKQQGDNYFIIIPAGDKYDLIQSDSDNILQFDAYRCMTREIEISGKTEVFKFWVLCRQNLTDEEILTRLYQGTVTESHDLFFVGYEMFPNIMQKSVLAIESDEVRNWHLHAKQLQIPEIMADLPEAVQQDISRNWNGADDVVIFSGNFTQDTEFGFDENHKMIAVTGTGEPVGYVIYYFPAEFFATICSGIAN